MTAELLDPHSQIRRRGVPSGFIQERDGAARETPEPGGLGRGKDSLACRPASGASRAARSNARDDTS